MNRIYLTLGCLIFFTSVLFSQKEANNWIFGFGNVIDFNTEPPTPDFLPNFIFFTERNSVSQSNSDGDLIFYSDGNSIFNKNHDLMFNGGGLLSDASSASHPVFVIPKPNSDNKYYLFTSTLFQGDGGLLWSEIDMSLDNGLGGVTANKNIQILDNSVGKITAVLHENLEDIWIVAHEWNSSSYQSFLVTENGIGNPITSLNVGSVIGDSNFQNGFGQIKTSPDGLMIAAVYQGLNLVEVFNFDRSTGQLSELVTLNSFIQPYGVEFSPNNRFLYVSQNGSNFFSGLRQFDLQAGSPSQILNSTIILGLNFPTEAGALQLGPDDKIYTINSVFDIALGVINEPNLPGVDCGFEQEGLVLSFTEFMFGLPSFFHSYLQKPYFEYSGFCPGGTTEFSLSQFDFPIDSVSWDFGDPNSGGNNFSNELSPSHQYNSSGSYNVKLTVYSNNQVFLNNNIVHIAPIGISLGPDQTVCENQVFSMNAYTPNATYLWSNNSTASSIATVEPGVFWVEVSVDTCGVLTDTLMVSHIPAPDVDLGIDRGLCNGVSEVLDITDNTPGVSYLWNNNSTSPIFDVSFGGNYSVTVTYPNGCTDTDAVSFLFDDVILDPAQADLKCFDDSSGVALVFPESTAGSFSFSYLWNTGDTTYTMNGLAAGTYTITVTDGLACTETQEFTLTEPPALTLDITVNDDNPNTTDPDGAVFLNPSGGTEPYVIEWDAFGELPDPVFDLAAGDYEITVTDDNDCEVIVTVTVGGVPVGVDDISFLEKIQLYPNPTSDFLFVKMPDEVVEDLEISVTNTLGQTLPSFFIEKNNEGIRLDVNSFDSGIYFLKIKKESEERTWKVNVIK